MNIDVTKIEGYAEMSAEDKVKVLEAFEYEDNSKALAEAQALAEKYKASNSKANSEIAEMKRKSREQMSADEKAKLESQEMFEKLEAENKTLKRQMSISENTSKYLALGYAEELAKSTAEAIADGNFDVVFENQKIHQENLDKSIRAEVYKNTPKPQTSTGNNGGMTQAEFNKLSYTEIVKFSEDYPELYKKFMNNK